MNKARQYVEAWDLKSMQCIHSFGGPMKATISCFEVLPDDVLAVGYESGRTVLWSLQTCDRLSSFKVRGNVTAIAGDSSFICVGNGAI